jgi:hypothetical protein
MSRCARPRTAPRAVQIQGGFQQCSRRSAQGRPRRPSSSGRASAAIAPIHPSGDIIVLEHAAFTCRGATLRNLAAEPLVMVDRAGQKGRVPPGPPCGQSPRQGAPASLRVRAELAGSSNQRRVPRYWCQPPTCPSLRRVVPKAHATRTPPVAAQQISGDTGFVDENVGARVMQRLVVVPLASRSRDIRPTLLVGVYGSF